MWTRRIFPMLPGLAELRGIEERGERRACKLHFAGPFTALSAEGGTRPDVYVGIGKAGSGLVSGPFTGLLFGWLVGRP
jgi:hypothetical protein